LGLEISSAIVTAERVSWSSRIRVQTSTHGARVFGKGPPLHEDLNYHRSTKHGVAPRLAHALTSTVVTRNTKNGKRTPAAGRIAGNAAAGAFTQGALAAGSGASTAGIGLAAEAGTNVVREFAPRRNRHPRKKK